MKKYLFILLVIVTILLGYVSKLLLNTDELVIDSLAQQMTKEQLESTLIFKEKLQWIGYLFIPILLLLKVSLIAAVLDLGMFFFEKEVRYKKLFNIVTKAEFVFILVGGLKIYWFYYFKQDYTLEDLQYFYPLSALNIVGYEGLQKWFIYPFQVLNLFELAYWFVLAYLLGKELKISSKKGLAIVASSYGVALLIWVVGLMFFTLNIS